MKSDLRFLVVAVGNILLLILIQQVNHYLSGWSIGLLVPGLLIAFAALSLNYTHGIASLVLTGLFFDATHPLPFGTGLMLLLLGHGLVYSVRGKFQRDEPVAILLVSLFANLLFFLGLGLWTIWDGGGSLVFVVRLSVDLLLSGLVVILLQTWYFAFQTELLSYWGIHLLEEQREAT